MPLFEVAVLEVPTAADEDKGVEEKLVISPVWVVAADAQQAGFAVIMDNPEDLKGVNKSRMKVLVRPFS